MKFFHLFMLILVSFAVSCSKKENPYRMEMDGLLHENKLLKETLLTTDADREKAEVLATYLQDENKKLEAELVISRQQVEELSAKNDDLNVQLGAITEREREANAKIRAAEQQKAEVKRQQELKRQQSLAAITAANQPAQPPFRVFDTMFVGKKEIRGSLRDVGRLSIRNYTDQIMKVRIDDFALGTTVHIPPNTSSNAIYVVARKGKQITIRGVGHTEKITW